ncbi:MAG: hypothetical protein KKA05_10375 [Alphaproteobacteria bacterium]|nr:hypothetical protein [Alphaproteobacteria bacterium]
MDITENHAKAIALIESAGHYALRTDRITKWPNLTTTQRMIALSINSLEFLWGACPSAAEIGSALGVTPDAVVKQLVEDYPFILVQGGPVARVEPSSRLQFGE